METLDGIIIAFPEDTQIIGPFTISEDREWPDGMEILPASPELNTFRVQFDQWAPGQGVTIWCYVGSQEALKEAPIPAPTTEILRGDWKVDDLRATSEVLLGN